MAQIKEGLLIYKCYKCGIDSWNDEPINLQLEHINGNHFDNRLENLTLLCPNCHSQTKTFCRKKNN
jgi:Zn finger protein HypA/HybF involved in hydrogenase expression